MTTLWFVNGASCVVTNPDDATLYTGELGGILPGVAGTIFESGLDAALQTEDAYLYLFSGSEYGRYNLTTNGLDEGYPRAIADNWPGTPGTPVAERIWAAVRGSDNAAYLCNGSTVVPYDLAADTALEASTVDSVFSGAPADLQVTAAVRTDSAIYLFDGSQYYRVDLSTLAVDEGYPMPIEGNWPALAGFEPSGGFTLSNDVTADGLVLSSGGGAAPEGGEEPSTGSGVLQPGDHVWYYAGQLSTDMSIPRQAWFPGSANETDYHGHGTEIFNFVVHTDGEIRRGRPHMRNHEGTFAWLNKNPGNLTGHDGGPDYGQYVDKFNWHNFLIFPSDDAGHTAIGLFLRNPGNRYLDLDITAAFERYAPASDGNDPVTYANDVAAAAGVPTTTLIRDLTDDQMRCMQDKIAHKEGGLAGAVLNRDSSELPAEILALL